MSVIGKNRNPIKPGQLSPREKVLKRTFKMYINKGRYSQEEFHQFCQYAKGKSESALLSELN